MPRRTIDHVSTQTKVINIATKAPIASPDIPVVCERIRYYRTLRGIEQGYIARTLGISPNSVSNWETGRTRPDINFLPRLCSMLYLWLIFLPEFNKLTQINRDTFSPFLVEIMPDIR